MSEEQLISSMVETIVAEIGPEEIILSGSRAFGGSNGSDSDCDLLMSSPDPFPENAAGTRKSPQSSVCETDRTHSSL
ncbi:MAG: hypothetical protein PHQ23_17560 [Candidatus Wallbacteria bacterium]|nr:hypothetical protein [Candidatus Wallbacteria bacterium]